jgi:hypothetical protein
MDKAKENNSKAFFVVADKLGRYHSTGGGFHVYDALVSALGESFKPGHSLRSELRNDGFSNVPEDLVEELREYGKELTNSPTEYFEAKPQRAVGIGEFKGAAVPEDVKPETLELLKQHGITNVERYKNDGGPARLRAVNAIADRGDLRLSEEDLPLEELKKSEPPLRSEAHEYGVHFSTGKPVTFHYIHNKEKAPNFGERFQQHIEPHGRYILHSPTSPEGNWEEGQASFKNPLVVPLTTDENIYGPNGWKARLNREFNAKGRELSQRVKRAGHDAIVTTHAGETREIVDLRQ